MKVLATIIFLLGSLTISSQFEICSPYGAGSCETAKYLCDDEHYDFCTCPSFQFTPTLSIFFTLTVYTFDVTEPGQSVNIQTEGSWLDVTTALIGPFAFESDCENLTVADSNNVVSIVEENVSIGNVTLPNANGRYYLYVIGSGYIGGDICPFIDISFSPEKDCIDECESCIGSFAPVPGQNYLIGAWSKEESAGQTATEYTAPQILIHFTEDDNGTITTTTVGPFTPAGAIIDGWQRIEEKFEIPPLAIDMEIELTSLSGDVLFDDVRVFPFDASMKTYVYDPINMRLAAELDERHYATFYEYDEEGKLVRIKKETEKGVMTIQETKSNSSKGN